MGHSAIAAGAGAGRDRLSDLDDGAIGHILSFLDAKEAARAAALSSRWRHVFASVHTVSLEQPSLKQPERPQYDDNGPDRWHAHYIARPFVATVASAILARNRRLAAAVPLRALRVRMEGLVRYDKVGQWVSYALRRAGPELDLDLRLARDPVCWGIDLDPRDYPSYRHDSSLPPDEDAAVGQMRPGSVLTAAGSQDRDHVHAPGEQPPGGVDDDDDAASSDDEVPPPQPPWYPVPNLPRRLLSCAALRSLRVAYCILPTPEVVSLPSLESLHITRARNKEEHVQRLISGCPLLADLTLEACCWVTALCLLGNTRLRRLALRLCDNLANVAIDASELLSFEYLGAIPDKSLLTISGGGGSGGGFPAITSCKIDTYVVRREEVHPGIGLPYVRWHKIDTYVAEDLVKLDSFLQLFVATKHLHLCSTRMGSYFVNLPEFSSLTHLELNGCVLRDDDPALAMAVTSSILGQAPNLELLTLVFQAPPQDPRNCGPDRSQGELLDMHLLNYDEYAAIDYTLTVSTPVPSCLMNRVSKIELVHYQGGRAQRTLAKFLLGNALALKKLYCGFAEGPEWIQMELMREIEGWVINDEASTEFR
ncbi:hypothetical protein ZWY2020_027234 [Hordeum vulgare]|nr:hypothetical protein ZWY2020_027234 [Hordeum vulgare]